MKNLLLDYFDGDELASEVWEKKYKLNDEKTPDDMFDRIAGELARVLEKRLEKLDSSINPNVSRIERPDKKINDIIQEVINDDVVTEDTIINSKLERKDIWGEIIKNKRNNTLKEYIRSFLGFDKIIPAGSMLNAIGNDKELSSISNCFVIASPHDSLSGINFSESELSNIEKRRGGVGIDLSTLRPSGSKVRNQSKYSSGVTLFEESFSNKNRTIAQNGRRGALMLSLSIKHPDALDFIKSKQDLTKVTGANISVKIDEDFIEAVKNNKDYIQVFPITIDTESEDFKERIKNMEAAYNVLSDEFDYNGVRCCYKIVRAKEIWNELIHCAWKTAEPGIIFENNWKKYGLDYGYEQYRPISTNPCSEIPMQPYDSCRLMSMNLYGFAEKPFKKDCWVDFEKIQKYSYIQLLLADLAIDLEIERVDKIIERILNDDSNPPKNIAELEASTWKNIKKQAQNGRRCGCGFTGLHDLLASKGLSYSSINDGFIEKIFNYKLKGEFQSTVDMSILFGHFEGFDVKKELDCKFTHLLMEEYPDIYTKMVKSGRRNISWSTAAPTGSLSILAGTTSGIEPLFMPFYKRRKKCITDGDRVDFVDVDGEKFSEYFVVHPKLIEYYYNNSKINYCSIVDAREDMEMMRIGQLNKIFKESPYFNSTANDIKYDERIDIQSIVQKYTTHSISSTLNLPKETTEEIISEIYMKSAEKGLKGNTIYRDGCRQGVLVSIDKSDAKPTSKRPNVINGVLHKIIYRKKTYSVIMGFIDNKPYEVFIISDKLKYLANEEIGHLDRIEGEIIKYGSNIYSFETQITDLDGEDIELSLYDLDDMEDKEEKIISLFVSKMLRENISIDSIVDLMEKSQPFVGTLNQRIMKILSKYSKDTEIRCPSCGEKLVRENGCKICKNCGWTAC